MSSTQHDALPGGKLSALNDWINARFPLKK